MKVERQREKRTTEVTEGRRVNEGVELWEKSERVLTTEDTESTE